MATRETRSLWQSPFSKAYVENGTIRSPILASAQDIIESLPSHTQTVTIKENSQ